MESIFKKYWKKVLAVRERVQWASTWLADAEQESIPVPQYDPRGAPGLIPEYRARSKPPALPGVSQKEKKKSRGGGDIYEEKENKTI